MGDFRAFSPELDRAVGFSVIRLLETPALGRVPTKALCVNPIKPLLQHLKPGEIVSLSFPAREEQISVHGSLESHVSNCTHIFLIVCACVHVYRAQYMNGLQTTLWSHFPPLSGFCGSDSGPQSSSTFIS